MIDSRLFGSMAIFILMILLYQAWIKDYELKLPTPENKIHTTEMKRSESYDAAQQNELNDLPKIDNAVALEEEQSISATMEESAPAKTIRVVTDLFMIEIDLQGGNVILAELREYPLSLNTIEKKVRLLDNSPQHFFIAQSGLQSTQNPSPSHHASYKSTRYEYTLGDAEERLLIPLTWEKDGIKVNKTFIFERDRYLIEVVHTVENLSDKLWIGRQYRQLQRTKAEDNGNSFIHTYTGGVIYSRENKYEKIPLEEMSADKLNRDIKNGWAAMIQHYFLSAWLPPTDENNRYYTNILQTEYGHRYLLGLSSPMQQALPGKSVQFKTGLYIGPKIQKRMENAAEGLELTVDYGLLTIISQPLFWLLSKIHQFLGNWGWSIVLLTLLIKLVFYKLSEAQYKSMANMRRVTPKLQALRERYADDRQRMSKAMMELYQKEKINPMGGCLPAIVQIPVFIALYWVLLESVELRQAPFMLWINDLSTKDPYFVLPLLMGITMYIQQKLNPAPVDPIQAKVFMMLPFIFTVFFAFFPSGLVLYWLANNTITIIQQWYITKKVIQA